MDWFQFTKLVAEANKFTYLHSNTDIFQDTINNIDCYIFLECVTKSVMLNAG